ncbi:hypothetical protein Sta7437_1202 [Stanieria cyanosphaera PCC 7437]|uniref:Nucleotide-diphospho-sugar transferase domain-containing protein n=1 Tax=Stanieria cyanosphaera (strain ATCC 29371 / PCC 7437) TaxID=111780 RepID=K9XSX4_STAC7|nr:hypothetical protein [Stanieria cyanosphaera]AFZ34772.1 hypothetical protein Sta7437_1202 [Stanieria cyanosphaera PCC 7437]
MNILKPKPNNYCFCTAAFGEQYRNLAKLLATDLNKFAQSFPLVIFTDRPQEFQNYSNVIAVKHWCRGVKTYHERRFAIQYALSYSDTVIYLDADVRICDFIPDQLEFLSGLTARSCSSMAKHLKKYDKKDLNTKFQRKKETIEKMANQVNVNLDSPDLKFINEFLFVIKADQGKELDFLHWWGKLAIYADTLGLHNNPTYAMSLAAVKTNFSVFHSEMIGLNFFDDRIEKERIKSGTSNPNAKAEYFRAQYEIEQKKNKLLKRLMGKIYQPLNVFYNFIRVRITTIINPSKLIDYQY